mmetsp:Transcript_12165/g.24820  ORF Transcript_12165/g.24820 Transcript_12165/m.24820 type:complete len:80 (+) Transcript_12165:291-530(+)
MPDPLPRNLPKESITVECHHCHQRVPSRVDNDNCTVVNWLLCLCFSLCCVFFVPACDCASSKKHYCGNCGEFLGDNGMM